MTCGRTSRLNRFLSMPRYDGASRRRMNRGTAAAVFPVCLQVGAVHSAVCKELCSPSGMRALERAGLSTSSRDAGPAAIEWQAYLTPAEVGRSRATRRAANHKRGILSYPIEHIVS